MQLNALLLVAPGIILEAVSYSVLDTQAKRLTFFFKQAAPFTTPKIDIAERALTTFTCNPPYERVWYGARKTAITQNISELQSRSGITSLAAGGCLRASCAPDGSIVCCTSIM